MVYTARLVVIGKTGTDPFVGFVLASGSLPYRRMEIKECLDKKIYVLPREGYERYNIDYPEVDNYACIIGSKTSLERPFISGFNGHMCKRCADNIKDGMRPEMALDSTLFEFRGAPKDARIGGVVYFDNENYLGFLGINDRDRMEKRVKGHKLEDNSARLIYVTDTSDERKVEVPYFNNASDLAKFLTQIMPGMEKVLAGGVCVLREKEMELGVHNIPIGDINKWAKK